MMSGKRILLGVTGGIAAYKAVDVLRRLREQNAEVRVVMTRNATRFVTPLTFSALSGVPVLTDEFTQEAWGSMGHIAVTEGLDLALVVPATANCIGKMAAGIADDALSTALMAAECPIVVAPAMNDRMFRNAVLQRNIASLRSSGIRIVDPDSGALACGTIGKGRLATSERILQEVVSVLSQKSMAGVKVLVTAGPTREPIDAVRFISNPSTGKMGYAVAVAARDRGAEVILISGPTHLTAPAGLGLVPVTTAAEMERAVHDQAASCEVIIMAAAVSDFRPLVVSEHKIKKSNVSLLVALEPTADILERLGGQKKGRLLVGFAAETDAVVQHAREKLKRKNLDLIIANDIASPGSGFASDTNTVTMIDRAGNVDELPCMTKAELAVRIIEKVVELKKNQGL